MCWWLEYLLLKGDSIAAVLNTAIKWSTKQNFYSVGRGLLGNDGCIIDKRHLELWNSDIQEVTSMIFVSSWSPVDQWTRFFRRLLKMNPRYQVFYNRSIVTQITQDISRILWNMNIYIFDKSPSLALFPNQMNSVNTIPPTYVRSILILSTYINKYNNCCWNRHRPSYPSSARKAVIISYYLMLLNCYY